MASYKSQPGVYIYDSFEYPDNPNIFMTSVIAQIEPLQYWRDRPLLINAPYGPLAPAVDISADSLAADTTNDTIIEGINEFQKLIVVQDEVMVETAAALDKLVNFVARSASGEVIVNPWPNDIMEVTNIKIPVSTTKVSMLDNTKMVSVLLDEVVLNKMETTRPPVDPGVAAEIAIQQQLAENVLEARQPVYDQAKTINDLLTSIPETPVNESGSITPEEGLAAWESLGDPQEQWYGIPLINIGPGDSPLKDSFIVSVDTKNGWNITVSNVTSTGRKLDVLTINKQIPPNKKFIIGFYVVYNKFGIVLRIEDDFKIYKKEINSFTSVTPKALSYGVDNDFVKSLSGHIWEVLFWESPTNFNFNLPSPEPAYPKEGWIYDFRKETPGWSGQYNAYNIGGTIRGNTLGTIYNYGPSARVGSGPNNTDAQFVQLEPQLKNVVKGFYGIHPWYFIYNSYVDNFFCRNKMQASDFTIIWHQWLFRYPTRIHNFISDPIYSNYLSYNYDNFQAVLEFNGHRHQETMTLPEEVWAQFALRYQSETNTITFSFIDLKYGIKEEVQMDIGQEPNFEFQLDSMFARHNKDAREYQEIHKGLFGMIMIHDEYKTDLQLREIQEEIALYLNQYTPQPEQLVSTYVPLIRELE